GRIGQMALNYDLTFLYLLLSSLYEPATCEEYRRCAVHPLQKQRRTLNEIADYCADMTVLLAYYNALDDWNDDHNVVKKAYADKLEKFIPAIMVTYPRQSKAIKEMMAQIDEIERAGEINLDAVAGRFGILMGELFVYKEDTWAPRLRSLGENLGKFIYFMDAWEDAKKDARHKNYNPLLQLKDAPDYEKRCKAILTLFLGQAAESFEALPIVDNGHILRNILYAGVWSKYAPKEKE
ncbi:MAG: hypothetical protein IJN42_05440, partial [Clostridia bacterium]|nr:hypothetical protein [Clostridia bacterium]